MAGENPNPIDPSSIMAELIQNNFEKIYTKFAEVIKSNYSKIQVKFNVAFRKYLTNAYEKYSKVKTLIYRTEPKYLYDFFVCNTIEVKNRKINADDIKNILAISNFLIMEGTGGIGKSTLMKHFFLNALEKKGQIPVFIELKDYNSYEGALLDFIYFTLDKLGFDLELEYLKYALDSGCFILLMDGYDEVSSEKSEKLFQQIDELCDRYSKNYYIISSRPNQNFIQFQRFTILKAQTFSKKQTLELVDKIDFDREIKNRFYQELEKTLYDKHKSFASNPLLLTIMLLTYDNYAEIPQKLHIFYSNAFETLYSKHDATKAGFKREMRSSLPYDSFKFIFAEFCFRTYIQNKLEFSYDDITAVLEKIKEHRKVDFKIEDYIKDLTDSICVLYLEGLAYKFTHRSFQEYFTAYYIKEVSDEQQYKIGMHLLEGEKENFDQVFDMLYDMSPDRYEKNIVLPLLKELEKSIDPDEDRYKQFFMSIVEEVLFERANQNDIIHGYNYGNLLIRVIITEKGRIIYKAAVQYTNYIRPSTISKTYEKEMCNRLEKHNIIFLSAEKILNTKKHFAHIKKTHLGKCIDTATRLNKILSDKHRKSIQDLNDLLNI